MFFDGQTYDPIRDKDRLTSQLNRVFLLMRDGKPRTLAQIVSAVGGTEPSVSARLRDLRKSRFGNHTVERNHIANGLWEYTLVI